MGQQHNSKSHFGNKAIVFTLDALVAFMFVIILLTFANFYFYRIEESTPSNLQTIKTGSDVMMMLYYNGTFNYYDADLINKDKNFLLPKVYVMKISIKTLNNPLPIETSEGIPSDGRFVASGRIAIAIEDSTVLPNKMRAAVGRYWIWGK
ncbi:hypothetical protein HYX18_02620 [Candidatus Woesearchaeota archaeon]|nr:hypothetical protein [Candidatus Woesearchaeota archaeon]